MGVNRSTADYVQICVEFYFYLLFFFEVTLPLLSIVVILFARPKSLCIDLNWKKLSGRQPVSGRSAGILAPLIHTQLVPDLELHDLKSASTELSSLSTKSEFEKIELTKWRWWMSPLIRICRQNERHSIVFRTWRLRYPTGEGARAHSHPSSLITPQRSTDKTPAPKLTEQICEENSLFELMNIKLEHYIFYLFWSIHFQIMVSVCVSVFSSCRSLQVLRYMKHIHFPVCYKTRCHIKIL